MGTRRSQALPRGFCLHGGLRFIWGSSPQRTGACSNGGKRGRGLVPSPTVTHVAEDLTPNAEVANRRNAISNAHGAVVLNQSENAKLWGTRKLPGPLARRVRIQLLFMPDMIQVLTPKHAPHEQRNKHGILVHVGEETIRPQLSVFSSMLIIRLGFLG